MIRQMNADGIKPMTFKRWCKKVEQSITERGYSPEYANAIQICVRNYYTDKYTYLEPARAAARGLFPPMYTKK